MTESLTEEPETTQTTSVVATLANRLHRTLRDEFVVYSHTPEDDSVPPPAPTTTPATSLPPIAPTTTVDRPSTVIPSNSSRNNNTGPTASVQTDGGDTPAAIIESLRNAPAAPVAPAPVAPAPVAPAAAPADTATPLETIQEEEDVVAEEAAPVAAPAPATVPPIVTTVTSPAGIAGQPQAPGIRGSTAQSPGPNIPPSHQPTQQSQSPTSLPPIPPPDPTTTTVDRPSTVIPSNSGPTASVQTDGGDTPATSLPPIPLPAPTTTVDRPSTVIPSNSGPTASVQTDGGDTPPTSLPPIPPPAPTTTTVDRPSTVIRSKHVAYASVAAWREQNPADDVPIKRRRLYHHPPNPELVAESSSTLWSRAFFQRKSKPKSLQFSMAVAGQQIVVPAFKRKAPKIPCSSEKAEFVFPTSIHNNFSALPIFADAIENRNIAPNFGVSTFKFDESTHVDVGRVTFGGKQSENTEDDFGGFDYGGGDEDSLDPTHDPPLNPLQGRPQALPRDQPQDLPRDRPQDPLPGSLQDRPLDRPLDRPQSPDPDPLQDELLDKPQALPLDQPKDPLPGFLQDRPLDRPQSPDPDSLQDGLLDKPLDRPQVLPRDRPPGPSPDPTAGPTGGPTAGPTAGPAGPTSGPTAGPTSGPTSGPTAGPTSGPTAGPTSGPTAGPTAGPTPGPTAGPTAGSTAGPQDPLPGSLQDRPLDRPQSPDPDPLQALPLDRPQAQHFVEEKLEFNRAQSIMAFRDDSKNRRLLDKTPPAFSTYLQHKELQFLCFPGSIICVTATDRNGSKMWEVKFFVIKSLDGCNASSSLTHGKHFIVKTHFVTETFLKSLLSPSAFQLINQEKYPGSTKRIEFNHYASIVQKITYTGVRKNSGGGYDCKGYLIRDIGGDPHKKEHWFVHFTDEADFFGQNRTCSRQRLDPNLKEKADSSGNKWVEIQGGCNDDADCGYEPVSPKISIPVYARQDPSDPEDFYNCQSKCVKASFSLNGELCDYVPGLIEMLNGTCDDATLIRIVSEATNSAYCMRAISKKKSKFWLQDISIFSNPSSIPKAFNHPQGFENYPIILEIKSGMNLHFIAVQGGNIIEVTAPFVLALTKENLDLIAGGKFNGLVEKAYILYKRNKPRKPKKKNNNVALRQDAELV